MHGKKTKSGMTKEQLEEGMHAPTKPPVKAKKKRKKK